MQRKPPKEQEIGRYFAEQTVRRVADRSFEANVLKFPAAAARVPQEQPLNKKYLSLILPKTDKSAS